MTTREFPKSLDAERAVLGACLMGDLTIMDEVAAIIDGDDFYSTAHTEVWRWMVAEKDKGHRPDVLALAEWMLQGGANRVERCGGIAYATALPDHVPASIEAPRYARIVKETAQRRRVVQACGQVASAVYDGQESEAVLTLALSLIQSIADTTAKQRSEDVPIADAVDEVWAELQAEHQALDEGRTVGMPTGFVDLDRYVSLARTYLSLWAGRPGMGKSQLLMEILLHTARQLYEDGNTDGVVYLTSLEMSKKELVCRWASVISKVPYSWMLEGKYADPARTIRRPAKTVDEMDAEDKRPGKETYRNLRRGLDPEDWDRVEEAFVLLKRLPIVICETPARSIESIRRSCLQLNRGRDLVMVGIDYIQLATTDTGMGEVERLTHIADGAKAIAKEVNCHVGAAVQLNRALEGRSDKRPQMSDLRGSGGLEQAANIIAGLYRDEYYNPGTTTAEGVAEVIILKNRNGENAVTAKLGFSEGRFCNLDRYHEPSYGDAYGRGGF